jgi:APA family basic amino acid/polyamine antiporter
MAGRALTDPWGERLPRRLGLWSAIGLLIANTIGSGIFRVPATVAGQLQHPGPILLAWAIGGVFTLCAALSLAELAAAIPRSGGLFRILHLAYGPVPAFMLGLAEALVIAPAGIGAVAVIFAAYLGHFVPLGESGTRYAAAAAVLTVGVLNYLGTQRASLVTSASTAAKYTGLVLLGVLALIGGRGSAEHFHDPWAGGLHLSLLASALVPVMFSYEGWADLSRAAGEIRDPGRNLPRAMVLGVGLVVLIYLAMNLVYLYLLPVEEMARSPLVAATAAARVPALGGGAAGAISALVMISTYGNLCGGMLVYPRTQFAMAEHGLSLGPLARVSPQFLTPSVAIWTITTLTAVSCLSSTFQQLTERFILGLWPFYSLAIGAVFVLRRTRPDLPRPYRVWGYPLVPALCLVAAVGIMANALWTDPTNTGLTFLFLAAGLPIYYLWVRPRIRRLEGDREASGEETPSA